MRRCIGVLAVLAIAACSDDPAGLRTPSNPAETLLPHAASELDVEDAERQSLDLLARSLAVALEDQAIRATVQNHMRNSRVREHKLELRAYLGSVRGARLVDALAQAAEISPPEVLALAEEIRPLEFYLPVPEHRNRWTGEEPVLVGWQLEDERPAHFFAGGQEIFVGPNQVPSTSVVALVPVETDFSEQYDASVVNVASTEAAVGTWAPEVRSLASGRDPLYEEDCGPEALRECGGGGSGGEARAPPTPWTACTSSPSGSTMTTSRC